MASDDLWPLFSRPGPVPDNPLSPVHMGGGMCWAAVSSLNSTVSEGWRSVVCTSSPSQALCVPMEPPEGHCVHQESVCVRKHCTNGHCNLFPLVHNTSIPLTCTPSLPQMHLSWKTRYIVFLPRPRVWGGLWEWPDLYPTTLERKSAVWLVPVSAVCSFLSKSSFFFFHLPGVVCALFWLWAADGEKRWRGREGQRSDTIIPWWQHMRTVRWWFLGRKQVDQPDSLLNPQLQAGVWGSLI